jgi:hypothetical protein
MSHKRIVRNTAGDIIDWLDEEHGGWIIRKGVVVNQEFIDEMRKKEEDRKIAARAQAEQITNPTAPDRTAAPSKLDELEKRIDSQDAKLDAILAALSKK